MESALLFLLALAISAGGYLYWRLWLADYEPPTAVMLWAVILVAPLALIGGHVAYFFSAQLPPAAAGTFFISARGWASGYQSLGMLTGVAVALALIAWINRRPFPLLLDVLSPAVFIISAVWRTGCFFHGCCYGAPANVSWAVCFPLVKELNITTPPSHPTQLYEVLASITLFLLLPRLCRHWRIEPGSGMLALSVGLLYSVERFLLDYSRIGGTATAEVLGLTWTQVIALAAAFICGVALLSICKQRGRNAAGC